MKKTTLICFGFLALAFASCKPEAEKVSFRKVIIGYVPGFRGLLDGVPINARKLTHINYAFVNVKDSMAWLENIATDTVNFRKLNALKKDNPGLKILISIGGWSWSGNFSDAVFTANARKKFARTSVDIVEQYGLDGVDIDWEYPGFKGKDNVFRTEDRENFTLMFQALREELDGRSAKTGRKYQLTTAVPEFTEFIEKTDMGKAAVYLDYVNLMLYDFYGKAGDTVGHHSNLYQPANFIGRAGHRGITEMKAAGVPVEKLVLGIPFYGKSWIMHNTDNRGINRMADSVLKRPGYSLIKDSLLQVPGLVRYWDDSAKGPYLFNDQTRQLITYDDEESVKIKCQYVLDNKLAGVMFWQYASDPKEYLLKEINKHFRK